MARHAHLEGLRGVLVLWVLCHHLTNFQERTITTRAHMAVAAFVQLSGFVTHLSCSGSKTALDNSSCASLTRFYVRRFDRVLFTTWVSMVFDLVVSGYGGGWTKCLGCFFFVTPWFNPGCQENKCPNCPSWTIGALLPGWLLYPFLLAAIRHLNARCDCGMWLLLLGAWLTLEVSKKSKHLDRYTRLCPASLTRSADDSWHTSRLSTPGPHSVLMDRAGWLSHARAACPLLLLAGLPTARVCDGRRRRWLGSARRSARSASG